MSDVAAATLLLLYSLAITLARVRVARMAQRVAFALLGESASPTRVRIAAIAAIVAVSAAVVVLCVVVIEAG